MQSIFGERANVRPFATYDNGVLEVNGRSEALEYHQLQKNSPTDLGEVDDTDSNLHDNSFIILNDRNDPKDQGSSDKILEDEVISMETVSPIELHQKKKKRRPHCQDQTKELLKNQRKPKAPQN
ncbi:hypothetical protein O181_023460 [Austropuccinia psidii MF-1]|uniref:Uncharacterized protein n=1 Tax=Austropuccinia psidii MF-1 TaxID=1389203 RepID=A0A9Q3GZ39_9BASI|nr:hypothetical protein [Austropuccinia psidii MF-1]